MSFLRNLIKKLLLCESEPDIQENDIDIESNSKIIESENIQKHIAEPNDPIPIRGSIEPHSIELYIGFDLGTSCSKVIVRDNIYQNVFPINFKQCGLDSNPYLLATKLYVSDDYLSLMRLTDHDKVVYDIKSNFFSNTKTSKLIFSNDFLLISYLVIAFYIIRKRVHEEKNIYKKSRINWHINVGAPCINIKDNKQINEYEDVILKAWSLSFEKEIIDDSLRINAQLLNTYLKKIEQGLILVDNTMKDFICVFPELFAAIKSQTSQNRLVKGKMYYMIDIGASTVDIATFNLFENEESDNNHAIFVPEVQHLGSSNFGFDLIDELSEGKDEREKIRELFISYSEDNLEYDLYYDFNTKVLKNRIYEKYEKEYRNQIGRTIYYTKNKFYPRAPEWRSGIPTLIVGGGSNFVLNGEKFYEKVLLEKFEVYLRHGISKPILLKCHPPQDFKENDILNKNYYRFLVADGLAHDKDSLGVVLNNVQELHEQKPEPLDIEDRYLSKEMT